MEKNEKSVRQKLVKNFAIVFIVVLLVLTFFSNTIMNYSLPEVATVPVGSGSVSQKVRCQGTVEVSHDTEITVSGKRKVKEVLVENGDQVKKDQVIMTFEAGEEDSELKTEQEALDKMEKEYAISLEEKTGVDYTDDLQDIENARRELEDARTELAQAKNDANSQSAAKNEVARLTGEIKTKNDELDQLTIEAGNYPSIESYYEYVAKQSDLESAIETAEAELENLTDETAIELKKAEIANLKGELAEVKSQLEAIAPVPEINKKIEEKKTEIENLNAALEEAKGKTGEGDVDIVKAAEDKVRTAEQTLDQKQREFEKKKKDDIISAKKEAITDEQTLKELEEQRKKVEKLKKQSDRTEIKSPADGIITGLSVTKGDEVSEETTIANIQLASGGYELSAFVTKTESKALRVGNEAEVENAWGMEVTATVKSIKADPSNPNQSSIVKFEIKGEAMPGETLQLSVGDKTGRYDTVVPNNAVKEDSDGKFVLVVKVKGTPLGNRYYVKKVKVEVPARDTANSAISGDVTEWDNVVTNASKLLDNGQQVRLTEKQ